jgi:sugar/nucleoside kinase (ribokinase family)
MREALERVKPDVVFGNEREWDAIGDVETPTKVVKRGARGIVVDGEERPAVPVAAVDSTGAGDALAAGFIVGGADLALETAARCVAQVGAMP